MCNIYTDRDRALSFSGKHILFSNLIFFKKWGQRDTQFDNSQNFVYRLIYKFLRHGNLKHFEPLVADLPFSVVFCVFTTRRVRQSRGAFFLWTTLPPPKKKTSWAYPTLPKRFFNPAKNASSLRFTFFDEKFFFSLFLWKNSFPVILPFFKTCAFFFVYIIIYKIKLPKPTLPKVFSP